MQLLASLRGYKKEYLKSDITAGIIIAALSIPISMGYAQVAGLPAVYGLYGSLIPTIIYSIFASSPQVVFGVDAAAAAITGSVIVSLGISSYSEEALVLVPLLAILAGVFLLIFSVARVGRLMTYVSQPVMGGFISGVAFSLMYMQVPKMMGLTITPSDQIITNTIRVFTNAASSNGMALALSVIACALIFASRKFAPKLPMPLFVLIGALLVMNFTNVADEGVAVLGEVQGGLPSLYIPHFSADVLAEAGGIGSLLYNAVLIAVVIMTESLLASNSFASKNEYRIDDNQELLAFGLANIASGMCGASPLSASVSRTGASEGFGGKTQLAPIISAVIMFGVLFLAPMLSMLPTPVLSAIVFCALTTVVEWDLARDLRKNEPREYLIFIGSCLGVLFFGIIPGVVIGVLLSFLAMLRQTADPPRTFIGTREDRHGYFSMARYPEAKPIPRVLMYRFSAPLSFANVGVFCDEIEESLTPDIQLVVIDAGGIATIDYTAVGRLNRLARKIEATGGRFYFANLLYSVADDLKNKGLERLMEKPGRGRDIEDVLAEFGIDPYPGVKADDFRAMKAQLHCSMLKDNDACDYVVRRHWKSGTPGTQQRPGTQQSSADGRAIEHAETGMQGTDEASDDAEPRAGEVSETGVPTRKRLERPHSGPTD